MSADKHTAAAVRAGLRPEHRLEISAHDPCSIVVMVDHEVDAPAYIVVDPYDEWPQDMFPFLHAATLVACWNACADAGLTVAQLDAGIIKQSLADAASLELMATALSQAMDRITELENTLNYGGVREQAGEVIAYIVRDRDGKINERYHAAVDSRWRYGTTANGLWCANEDAARIGGTVSAIMTDGADTWEDGPSDDL